MSLFIDPIPAEYQPTKENHVAYLHVYRATISSREEGLSYRDFVPTFLENPSRKAALNGDQSFYSVSLFLSKKGIEDVFKVSKSFRTKHKGITCGFTSLSKGISTEANIRGHVDYFLFDYKNNSPCDEFSFVHEEENK